MLEKVEIVFEVLVEVVWGLGGRVEVDKLLYLRDFAGSFGVKIVEVFDIDTVFKWRVGYCFWFSYRLGLLSLVIRDVY